MSRALKYRPHHFMCTLGFQGKGYSPGFVDNFQAISDRLRGEGGDEVVLEVVGETDSICAACPHQDGPRCGSDETYIQTLDERHARALSLKPGDYITWAAAKQRIAIHVDETTFDAICAGCPWKELGICLDALRDLSPNPVFPEP
jgi:hypothetical protein